MIVLSVVFISVNRHGLVFNLVFVTPVFDSFLMGFNVFCSNMLLIIHVFLKFSVPQRFYIHYFCPHDSGTNKSMTLKCGFLFFWSVSTFNHFTLGENGLFFSIFILQFSKQNLV